MANKNVIVTPIDNKEAPGVPKGGTNIPKIVNPPINGDVTVPGQPPVVNQPVQTMNTNTGTTADGSVAPTLNEQIWGEGGTKLAGYNEQVEQYKQGYNPNAYASPTEEEIDALMKQLGIDPNQYAQGGYSQNGTGDPTKLPGTGADGWYYNEGNPRPVQAGTSGADESLTNAEGYAYIQLCKIMYDQAKTPEEKAYWHNEAEKIRAGSGYSGGADGSMYIPIGQLSDGQTSAGASDANGAGGTGAGAGSAGASERDLYGLLEQWKEVAEKQANGQIDYAVEQAIKELERALEDAQPQFKETAESISREERQAMDNSALYAELRGDRGGIGQEQYNSIQNTAAQNRLAVQQAQTKLSTDTARQIADLRAQGEFEKADKALEITQQYLAQLITLEQWAAEFNFSQEQFQASLKQWEAEYNMAMEQMGIAQEQWQKEFDFAKDQFEYDKYMDSQNQLSAMAEMMFSAGQIDLMTDEQLKAMGFSSRADAKALYEAMAAASATAGTGNLTGIDGSKLSNEEIYMLLYDGGYGVNNENSIKLFLESIGVTGNRADLIAGAYKETGHKWVEEYNADRNNAANFYDEASLNALGLDQLVAIGLLPDLSVDTVRSLVGTVLVAEKDASGNLVLRNGKPILKWAPGWSAQSFANGYPALYSAGVQTPKQSVTYQP